MDILHHVLTDYRIMYETLGPLDFATFCEGYAAQTAWYEAREAHDRVEVRRLRRETANLDSHAA